MKKCIFLFLALMVLPFNANSSAGELDDLFHTVEALKIERQGYVLCAKLSDSQLSFAQKHREEANSEKVYKFQDKGLTLVTDAATHRVLVMYEQFNDIGQTQVQGLVGELFLSFEDPTVSAHDKVIYWAWGKKEKFTADQFDMAKENKQKLAIMATVKLNSEIKIMDKTQADARGNAYYIISSDPLLRFFQDTSE